MKILLSIILSFFCWAAPLWAQTQEAAPEKETFTQTQSLLRQAAEAYFDGNPADALTKYIEISKDTQERDAFLNAAFIALEQGTPKQAVDIMTSAYILYPQDEDVLEFTAEAYLADGQYENAEKFFSFEVFNAF